MMEKRSKDNMAAQVAANQTVVKQVSAYQGLKEELLELDKLQENLKEVEFASLLAKGGKYFDEQRKKLMNYTEAQESAIKGTLAYSKAVLENAKPHDAMAAGLDELIKKGKIQKDLFKERQREFIKAKRREEVFGKEALSTADGRKRAQIVINADAERKGKVTGGVTRKERLKNVLKTSKNVADRMRGVKNPNWDIRSEDNKNEFLGFKDSLKLNLKAILKQTLIFKKDSKFMQGKAKVRDFYEKMKIKYQLVMLKLAKRVKPVLNFLFKMLIMSMFVFMGLLLFMKAAYDVFELFKSVGALDLITEMFYTALTMVGAFFGLIGAFITGDYEAVMGYLMTLIDGALLIVGNLVLVALVGLGALLVGAFYTIIDTVSLFITSGTVRKYALQILIKFAKIYFIAWAVKTLAIQIAQLIAIYAMPVLFVVSLAALLYAIVAFAFKKIKGSLPFMAEGGVAKGGMTVVGERGPELVNLPKGARVHSNRDSKKMVAASSGGNTINITINARDTSDAELRRIADKIGNMVNNKINRRTSSRTLG